MKPDTDIWEHENLCDKCLFLFEQGADPKLFCDRCREKINKEFHRDWKELE